MKDASNYSHTNLIYTIAIVFVLLGALVVGGFVTSAAWDHNPNCEFHCEGYVNWVGLTVIFVSSSIMGSAIAAVQVLPLVFGGDRFHRFLDKKGATKRKEVVSDDVETRDQK